MGTGVTCGAGQPPPGGFRMEATGKKRAKGVLIGVLLTYQYVEQVMHALASRLADRTWRFSLQCGDAVNEEPVDECRTSPK